MKPSLAPIIGYLAFNSKIPMFENKDFNINNIIPQKISVFGHGKNRWNIDGIEVIAKTRDEAQWKANKEWYKFYTNK